MLRLALALAGVFVLGSGFALRPSPSDPIPPIVPRTVIAVWNPAPLVSFDIHVAGPDGVLALPPAVDLSDQRIGAEGVWVLRARGRDHAHIASVSRQASGVANSDIDMDAALRDQPGLAPAEAVALAWLGRNRIELDQGAIVWHYTFDHSFNEFRIRGGWPSAFAQADLIKAYMLAERRTGDARYRALALGAAYAFTVPCERGGVRCVAGGVPWFEEIPLPFGHAPTILNGHLYSVVMLHRLWQETGDRRVKAAFEDGLASARAMLMRYDTGYWTVYQMRPRLFDLPVMIAPDTAGAVLKSVTATSPLTGPSSLRFARRGSRTYPGNGVQGLESRARTRTGATAHGLAAVTLLPGRPATTRDLIAFPGFDIALRFTGARCDGLRIGTLDWRATGAARYMATPTSSRPDGDACVATATLSNTINQWSQLTPFYHDWHTRLVTELWRITGDAFFYATAVRWRQYAHEYDRTQAASFDRLQDPIFAPHENAADDAAILAALGGAEPDALTGADIAHGIRRWLRGRAADPRREAALLARAGLRAAPASAERRAE